jgi:hypothetical protein
MKTLTLKINEKEFSSERWDLIVEQLQSSDAIWNIIIKDDNPVISVDVIIKDQYNNKVIEGEAQLVISKIKGTTPLNICSK